MAYNKKSRTLISMILSFFLAVCFFVIIFSAEMFMGYLGIRNFKDSITESYYVENAINHMKADISTLLEGKSVPPELLKDVLDETICYVEIRNYIDAELEGRKLEIDASDFEIAMEQRLSDYLVENQIYETEGVRATVDEIVKQSGKIYEKNLKPEFVPVFYQFRTEMKSVLQIAAVVAIVIGVVIVGVLWFLYHHKYRSVRYVMISMSTALIWNLIATMQIKKANVMESLDIGPEMYVDFIKTYSNSGIGECWIMSAIVALLCITMYTIVKYLKRNAKRYRVK